jgi:hypothetical protein
MIGSGLADLIRKCGYPSGTMTSIIGVCLILVGFIGLFAGMAKDNPEDKEIKQVNFKWGGVSMAFGVITIVIGIALLVIRKFFMKKLNSE